MYECKTWFAAIILTPAPYSVPHHVTTEVAFYFREDILLSNVKDLVEYIVAILRQSLQLRCWKTRLATPQRVRLRLCGKLGIRNTETNINTYMSLKKCHVLSPNTSHISYQCVHEISTLAEQDTIGIPWILKI